MLRTGTRRLGVSNVHAVVVLTYTTIDKSEEKPNNRTVPSSGAAVQVCLRDIGAVENLQVIRHFCKRSIYGHLELGHRIGFDRRNLLRPTCVSRKLIEWNGHLALGRALPFTLACQSRLSKQGEKKEES